MDVAQGRFSHFDDRHGRWWSRAVVGQIGELDALPVAWGAEYCKATTCAAAEVEWHYRPSGPLMISILRCHPTMENDCCGAAMGIKLLGDRCMAEVRQAAA